MCLWRQQLGVRSRRFRRAWTTPAALPSSAVPSAGVRLRHLPNGTEAAFMNACCTALQHTRHLCCPHSLAVLPSVAGFNRFGLAPNQFGTKYVPVEVVGSQTFQSLSCGQYHCCALNDQGQALCWGVSPARHWQALHCGCLAWPAHPNLPALLLIKALPKLRSGATNSWATIPNPLPCLFRVATLLPPLMREAGTRVLLMWMPLCGVGDSPPVTDRAATQVHQPRWTTT